MSELALTKTSLIAGIWQGVLSGQTGADAPQLRVTHLDRAVDGVEVLAEADSWTVRVPIPAALIADGVQSFVIADARTGAVLNSFAVVAGDALAEDIRAELDLLRAELDMLKRAFRRHCVETT